MRRRDSNPYRCSFAGCRVTVPPLRMRTRGIEPRSVAPEATALSVGPSALVCQCALRESNPDPRIRSPVPCPLDQERICTYRGDGLDSNQHLRGPQPRAISESATATRYVYSEMGWIRTSDSRIFSPQLYRAELPPHVCTGPQGFEPRTHWATTSRSAAELRANVLLCLQCRQEDLNPHLAG